MRAGPRQLDSESELYNAAVGALARRAHSVFEMRKYLERRASEKALVPQVLARLRARGLLDDARYAASFARARSANRRQGSLRIARELRARGVADRYIQAALEGTCSPAGDRAALRRRIELWLKRHGIDNAGSLDRRRSASLYRSLFAAGFPADAVRAELGRLSGHGEDPAGFDADEG